MRKPTLITVLLGCVFFAAIGCQPRDRVLENSPLTAFPGASQPQNQLPASPAAASSTPTFEPDEPTLADGSQGENTATPELANNQDLADADVVYVRAVQSGDGAWTFHVTVSHPDTGWEDYADGWDVQLPDGTVLKKNNADPFTRLLLHPHENEQPFTRSQSGIVIPEGSVEVTVRAHDIVHGYGGSEVVIELTAVSGPDYEIERP